MENEELEEFDYDETRNILFKSLKDLSNMKFQSEEMCIERYKAINDIAMTLLETE